MVKRLSQSEWDRIRQFANTPTYDREPEMLAPEGEGDGDNRGAEARPPNGDLNDA